MRERSSVFFIDTEFNEFGGELISLAIVPLHGDQHFYEVLSCDAPGPWVAQHVMPILNKPAISKALFQNRLAAYLFAIRQRAGGEVTIVADWPDDIRHLCESLIVGPGKMLGIGSGFTFALRTDLGTQQSALPHNALADAHALRDDYIRSLAP